MKMTKIESARIIAKQKGYCRTVHCKDCFITEKCYKVDEKTSDVLQRFMSAEAYIKRHEGKSKKRIIPKYTADIQPDKTGSELKKIVMKPAKHDPTPLEIAKAIRDKDYVCRWSSDVCKICPIRNAITGQERCGENRKQLIDSYISSHEKPEPVIEPIKFDLPEIVYIVSSCAIRFINVAHLIEEYKRANLWSIHISANNEMIVEGEVCYKTLDEAVAVAKKTRGLK